MKSIKWIWDWHVEIWLGLLNGLPIVEVKWTQRTPPPWHRDHSKGAQG